MRLELPLHCRLFIRNLWLFMSAVLLKILDHGAQFGRELLFLLVTLLVHFRWVHQWLSTITASIQVMDTDRYVSTTSPSTRLILPRHFTKQLAATWRLQWLSKWHLGKSLRAFHCLDTATFHQVWVVCGSFLNLHNWRYPSMARLVGRNFSICLHLLSCDYISYFSPKVILI